MNEQTYIILNSDNKVINTVIWNGNTSVWSPPAGTTAVPFDQVDPSALAPLTSEPTPQVSPVELAEQHVSSYFSTPKLLQMKVWWDTFPHTSTPKLSAVYDWTNNITIQAAQGQTNFVAPSYTFDELLIEAISLVNP